MKKILIALLTVFMLPVIAKDIRVRSKDDFFAKLSSAPYTLAIFYDRDREIMKDKEIVRSIKDLEIQTKSLSQNPFYKGADLQFMRVDLDRKELESVAQQFNITTLPTYLLFVGRELVGKPLVGFAYRSQVQKFIDQNLLDNMNSYMKEKQQQRARDLERAKIRAYNNAYLWGPYWNPYWSYGYAPYWGFGYRPYYRWYYW